MRRFLLPAIGAALAMLAPAGAMAQPRHDDMHRPDRGPPPPASGDYGRWDSRWGSRPAPPPRHWGKKGDWYRHVRACQVRYRNYNPRTDTYRHRGQNLRCRL